MQTYAIQRRVSSIQGEGLALNGGPQCVLARYGLGIRYLALSSVSRVSDGWQRRIVSYRILCGTHLLRAAS